ncbi:TetR/AcrR family transcriptional regulator [Kribbella sp. NBC_01245]|uniref:TetR/AcrR family transcriptional regulator n=1 Tax=Kribbella sp. NBC_01245 TaxID=2903578 RepID=UPI002E2E0A1D|nr:TetR/AcrR family transcriptional regulator [Kribbella sp. NBC_01245]
MKNVGPSELDRRSRRRRDTIEEILDVSLELMAAEGVAALSLSAVARRVGMRPPSLYQYFDSKMAIYDALFQRGSQAVRDTYRAAQAERPEANPLESLRIGTESFTRWCIANPIYCQLLFWRTVPGFEPSPEAYAPAVESVEDLRTGLQLAVDAGLLSPAAATDEGVALHSALVAGLLSQQLANEPDASFEDGRFTRLLPAVLELFVTKYQPSRGKK